ncbi:hypothetical protein MSG28_007282 [Choristoneura fumiferana]|uniref:Uncharacterized protein n=1 Tax=Choristoneura fumiferana TaxID=7141 RepID=A0ACC0JWF2_CHOFU|nr:hypothetical protein MSG28_007282 [Choristoneura fumiferana]
MNLIQLSPYKIEFGHVCEDPNTWEQRYEKKDFKNHRDMGKGHRQGSERHFTERHERARPSDGLFSAKVRWGDKKGGYGEHYWDLNHAGHTGDHGNDEYDGSSDDGSYKHDLDHAYDGNDGHDSHDNHDSYDEPSEQAPSYGTEEYDPEKAAKYDENGRAKRAYPRIKTERKHIREEEMYEEEPQVKPQPQAKPQKGNLKIKERLQAASTQQVENVADDNTDTEQQPPKRRRQQRRQQQLQENDSVSEQQQNQDNQQKEEPNNQEPQQNQPQQQQHQQPQQYYAQRQTENQFVPYEQGAGVRQHHRPEISAAASAPRLFLEPTTGHVVDRATGQAYVAAAPVDGRVESDGTYKRLYLPYIESVAKDGTIKILTSEDLLGLAKKLEAGDIPVTTIHRIIGVNNFNNTLSDHQLRRMANHEVAAIVNPEDMKKPGFGHLFLTIDDKGIIQTFIYNLTLEEAMEKAKNEAGCSNLKGTSVTSSPPSVPQFSFTRTEYDTTIPMASAGHLPSATNVELASYTISMPTFLTPGRHGYSVRFSRTRPDALAVATSQYYGLAGGGTLFFLELAPDGATIWDPESEACLSTFAGHSQLVYTAAFSPHSPATFASVSGDGHLKLWSCTEPSRPAAVVKAHDAEDVNARSEECNFPHTPLRSLRLFPTILLRGYGT